MARKAGVITIDLNAGTAKFLVDMDKANAKVAQFGAANRSVISDTKATTAAIKALEGGFANNTKAATAFIAKILGGGPILQAAFPIFGLAAFGGVLAEIGTRTAKFFRDMQTGPERASGVLREMSAPLRQANDELAVMNARLENDIAKLEGRRENTLKVALLEAKAAADKLAESLEKDLASLDKILKENEVGFWQHLFGKAKTDDIRKLFGGETGYGGLRGSVAMLTDQFSERLSHAGTQAEKDTVQKELNVRLKRLYQAALDQVNAKLAQTPGISVPGLIGGALAGVPGVPIEDTRVRVEELKAAARVLQEELARVSLTAQNTTLKDKKEALESDRTNAALNRPFDDRLKALQAQFEGARAKMAQAGLGPEAKAVAESYAEALKVIADINKELERHHGALTDTQKAQIETILKTTALTNVETQWKDRLAQATAQIRDQVQSQEMLTAAIRQGADVEQRARVEMRVMAAVGAEHYGDTGWMKAHAADVAKLRTGFTSEAAAQRTQQSAEAVYSLEQEIRLQKLLTEAQAIGEEEIRQITAMEIWRVGIQKGLTGQQIAAEISLFYAKQRNSDATAIAKIKAETTAVEKLVRAQLEGAEAARKQALENKYAEMGRTGAGGAVAEQRKYDEAAHQAEITQQVAGRINLYKDQSEKLDQERDALLKIIGGHKATVDQARALRELQQERLRLWVQEQLAIGTARAGVRAFFGEMQAGSKRTANIIYDNLTSAVDRVSDELARLMTGQKTSFGRMLQDLGQSLVRDTIKNGLERGLGKLGDLLGIKIPAGKPDFTKANPGHVIVENWPGQGSKPATALGDAVGGVGGVLLGKGAGVLPEVLKGIVGGAAGLLRGIFGGGGKALQEAVSSSITYMAGGGLVSPNEAYIVGDAGPELLTRTSGYITSNAELRRTLGSGGNQYFTTVDARGADLGVERRVYRAIDAAHRAAVANSVRAVHERAKRVPQRMGA